MLAHVIEVALSGHFFNDEPQHDVAAVGVLAAGARLEAERLGGEQRQVVGQVPDAILGGGGIAFAEEVTDAARHVQEVPHRDLCRGIRVRVIGQVDADGRVELKLALSGELLDGDLGDELVDGTQVEAGVQPVWRVVLPARQAIGLLKDGCGAPGQQDDAGELVPARAIDEKLFQFLHELGLGDRRLRFVRARRAVLEPEPDAQQPVRRLGLERKSHFEPFAFGGAGGEGDGRRAGGLDPDRLECAGVFLDPPQRLQPVFHRQLGKCRRREVVGEERAQRPFVGIIEGAYVSGHAPPDLGFRIGEGSGGLLPVRPTAETHRQANRSDHDDGSDHEDLRCQLIRGRTLPVPRRRNLRAGRCAGLTSGRPAESRSVGERRIFGAMCVITGVGPRWKRPFGQVAQPVAPSGRGGAPECSRGRRGGPSPCTAP